LSEMAQDIQSMSGALMGIAEYIVNIDEVVKQVNKGIGRVQISLDDGVSRVLRDRRSETVKFSETVNIPVVNIVEETPINKDADKAIKNELLAQKVEKLLAVQNNSVIEEAKDEISKQIEINLMRMLAAILVTGPQRTQMGTGDIFKMMKSVLNGHMDFRPVVQKLPYILRESETNQFTSILRTLRDNPTKFRQFGGLENMDKVIDALGGFDVKQVSGFLKELPELFEGIETVVDGVDSYFP